MMFAEHEEGWMRRTFIIAAVLVFPLMVAAQTNVAPRTNSQGVTPAAPGFSLPNGLNPAAGLLDQFWNDPATVAELHLTDQQRKQLQDAALTQQLALIDGGADALKAVVRMSALLDADQLDDAAYKKQLSNLAAATGKVVEDFGEMVGAPRRVLSQEQWRKLQSIQKAKRAAAKTAAAPRPSSTHAPMAGERP
jgi:Spy/CpxP family protein refolding chaperone